MAETTSPTSPAASAAAQEDLAAAGFVAAAAAETTAATEAAGQRDVIVNMVSSLAPEERDRVERQANDSALTELRAERKALAKQRADVSRRMRAEQKKRTRLLEKAQRLSNNELLEVFAMRMKRNEARASSSAAMEQQGERP